MTTTAVNITPIKQLIQTQLAKIGTIDYLNSDIDELYADLSTNWVCNYDELDKLLHILENCDEVALDTEFHKRDTYYPKLSLIQVNTGEGIYLIDALKLTELSELWAVLAQIPVIIWHACGEDLNIFYLLSDLPTLNNVFDTQIAMAFLTGKMQLGFQKSVADMLAVDIDKEQSQSDWLARPLSAEQELYAANDVKYLLPLYRAIVQKLLEKELFDYVWQDCQLFADKIYQDHIRPDDKQYLSAVSSKHSGLQREFLRELLAWREGLARGLNKPKTFIIKKQAVSELAELLPTSIKQLKYDTTLYRTVIDTYGQEILRLVKNAKQVDASTYPAAKIANYRSKEKVMSKLVNAIVSSYSAKTGIPKTMIIKKKWLEKAYQVVALEQSIDELPKALKGWRFAWVKDDLLPALEKHKKELRKGMDLDG